jgi:hypothetical protein
MGDAPRPDRHKRSNGQPARPADQNRVGSIIVAKAAGQGAETVIMMIAVRFDGQHMLQAVTRIRAGDSMRRRMGDRRRRCNQQKRQQKLNQAGDGAECGHGTTLRRRGCETLKMLRHRAKARSERYRHVHVPATGRLIPGGVRSNQGDRNGQAKV